LRRDLEKILEADGLDEAIRWLSCDGVGPAAAGQAVAYLSAAREALGCLPTRDRVVLERFFDDTGDMHLVVHAPLGSRIMRAWGLALRKRFCRSFNFELQASALEDCLILSLGETHSFESQDVPGYLKSASARQVLIQALLDAPLFEVRWRWNATISLAVQRMRNGQKLPPQWQRNQAEDLVAVVFPDQLACLENIQGEREIPDHPLVTQTIDDCLMEAMDVEGLEDLLGRMEAGEMDIRCVDLNGPSPLSAEIINARPYAFLDDGEAENRRTRAISQGPNDLGDAATLSIITVDATDQVRSEAWIRPRSPDELHDGLLQLGFLTEAEYSSGVSSTGSAGTADQWGRWFQALTEEFRASCVSHESRRWWVATERLSEFLAVHQEAACKPDPSAVFDGPEQDPDTALNELLRGRLSGLGPVKVSRLAQDIGLSESRIETGLAALQAEGYAMVMQERGSESPGDRTWCERRLLARIHRYSRERRRKAVRPVSPAAYMRFLLHWHGFEEPAGELEQVLGQLEGWVAPISAWEQGLLASRCADYSPQRLDEQFLSGFLTWFRPDLAGQGGQLLVAATPIALVPRLNATIWQQQASEDAVELSSLAERLLQVLQQGGALFTADLAQSTGLMQAQLEQGLSELIARGMITADAFSPLRWLIRPEADKRRRQKSMRRGGRREPGLLGRWSITRAQPGPAVSEAQAELFPEQARMAAVCEALLRRYGVVFRAVLERESMIPPWRHLLRYLRRMEDRGEVRGGRFVDGFSGEQFALPEAVGLLRRQEKADEGRALKVVSAADPLNLGGIITPGVKTAARAGSRILLLNGVPAARIQGDDLELLSPDAIGAAEAERQLRQVLSLRQAAEQRR
jgi:ATP-dependent Lhr-like helicase